MKETYQELLAMSREHVLNTYAPDTMFVRGSGCWLWDFYDNRYLDFGAGISVCNLGHCHPAVTAAICAQAQTLVHTSNLYFNANQPRLAAKLAQLSFGGKVFFCNSGAEANEGLIKFARRWGSQAGGKRHEILCATHAFHGRTLATLAATAKTKYREGFAPDMPGFRFAEYNNLEAFRQAVTPATVAILVEPIQGEGGVIPATPEFLRGLQELCQEKNLLLLFDEIQCGMGRTGDWFAHQHFGVTPDGMSLAKALGNGLPIGAFIIQARYGEVFEPGTHGSTFGGTPLACAAAMAVLETFEQENILRHVREIAPYLRGRLQELQRKHTWILDVRGIGLLLGLQAGDKMKPLAAACRRRRLLVLTAGEDVVRLLPPLVITRAEVDQAIDILDAAMTEVEQG